MLYAVLGPSIPAKYKTNCLMGNGLLGNNQIGTLLLGIVVPIFGRGAQIKRIEGVSLGDQRC